MDANSWKKFLAHRDEAAFTPIYEAAKARVYTIARRLTADEEESLDAFQSTWTRLLTEARANRVPPGVEPVAYLSRLAVREADALRQRRRRRAVREVVMEDLPENSNDSASPRDAVARGEQREVLMRLIGELPEQQRIPILMHYFDGLTHREIAEALDVPLGTISYRIAEAHKRLQPLCQRAGIDSATAALALIAAGAALTMPPATATAASVFAAANVATAATATAAGGFVITKGAVAMIAGAIIGIFLAITGTNYYYSKHSQKSTAQIPATSTTAPGGEDHTARPSNSSTGPTSSSGTNTSNSGDSARVTNKSKIANPLRISLRWSDDNDPVMHARAQLLDAEKKPIEHFDFALDGDIPFSIPVVQGAAFVDITHEEADKGAQRFAIPSDRMLTEKLKRGTVVFGTVVDAESEQPSPDAEVTMALWSDRQTTATLADGSFVMRTDNGAAGGFVFAMTETQSTFASQDESNYVNLKANHRNGPYRLQLREGKMLSVLVLDAATKSPIAGAEVLSDHGQIRFSDSGGVARFPGLSPREWQFQVKAKSYALRRLTMNLKTAADSVLEAQLTPGGRIHGRVTGENGAPFQDVNVRDYFSGPIFFGWKAKTDADGRYELENWFLDDEFSLRFEKELLPSVAKSSLIVPATTRALEVNAVMAPGVELIGTIVDPQSRPIAGASVEFGGQSTIEHRETKTDPFGRFKIAGVGTASDTLTVTAEGYTPHRRTVDGGRGDIHVVLQPGSFIRARVIDGEKKPIPGVNVSPLLSRMSHHYLGSTVTDQNGLFEFKSLTQESVFDIYKEGYSDLRNHTLPLNQPGIIEVTLPAEGVIFGRIVDEESDKPVARFNVKLNAIIPVDASERFSSIEVSRISLGTEFDSPIGAFRLEELGSNSPVTIKVTAEGYAQYEEKVYAQPANIAAEKLIKLKKNEQRKIAGKILNADGSPAAGARVMCLVGRGEDVPWRAQIDWPNIRSIGADAIKSTLVTADESGSFLMMDHPVLPIADLLIFGDGIPPLAMFNLQQRTAEETGDLMITLAPACALRLEVNGSVFPPGAMIDIAKKPIGKEPRQLFLQQEFGAKDFAHTFSALPWGEYEIAVFGVTGTRYSRYDRRSINLSSSEYTVRIGYELRKNLTGSLISADGTTRTQTLVVLRDAGQDILISKPAANGEFDFSSILPGKYVLSAQNASNVSGASTKPFFTQSITVTEDIDLGALVVPNQ